MDQSMELEEQLLSRLRAGDQTALGQLCDLHRPRLMRMVSVRMDKRMQRRIDPADVVQDAFLEVARRIHEFKETNLTFFVWLRLETLQKLVALHRHHVQAKMRDVSRDISLYGEPLQNAASDFWADQLLARSSSPGRKAIRAELQRRLYEILDEMDPLDREILTLRHFEQLSNVETAQTLKLNESSVSTRHVRALKQMRQRLAAMPEFRDWLPVDQWRKGIDAERPAFRADVPAE